MKKDKKFVTKVNKELAKSIENYKKVMSFMVGDVPIQALCLDKKTESILLKNGFLRVFDLFNLDLTEIEGIGKLRSQRLASRLHEFVFVS